MKDLDAAGPLPSSHPPRDADAGSQRRADLARYYDLDMLDVREDLEMYLTLAAREGGPILELAAGSGRVSIPLARAGYRVVALDNDPAMLDRARCAWRDAWRDAQRGQGVSEDLLELVEADMTAFRAPERFGLVVLALNSLLLLPDEAARLAALRTMSAHLRPGGLAVVDVTTPDADELATFDGRLQLEWLREDPDSGDLVTKLISARLDPETASVTLTQLFDAAPPSGGPLRRVTRVDTLQLVSAPQLQRLARRAGLGDVELRGDHRLTPHGAGSHRAILMGRLL